MVVYEKIFRSINKEPKISFKTNNAQLYFILGTAKQCWKFSTVPKDGSDIHRFSSNHMH